MKLSPVKQLVYSIILVFSIGCVITACTKKTIPPNTTYTKSKGDSTTTSLDSLPTFYSPAAVAVDAAGNVYVADYGNDMIRKITPGGKVSTLAGSGVQGSVNGTGEAASFNRPSGVAVDANGNVYVADAGNSLIREVSAAGVVTTVAGGDTTGAANGPGASATFNYPTGVALDAAGNLYVADAGNNLIRLISNGTVSIFAGSLTDTTLNFNNPTGVAVDLNNNVYVAGYLNNDILKINQAGLIATFAGSGSPGSTNGQGTNASFYYPSSVATDAAGNVYVADEVNNLIRKITPNGTVTTLAGNGTAGAADSTGTAASFNGPAGIAVDATGNVYVADANNNLIRKITAAGVVTTLAGSGLEGYQNGQAAVRRIKTIKVTIRKLNMFVKPKGHS
ncbi:NHL repeat-containing protein [Mucilaginibacter frigoritolerans]|uniref:NHL repeat-containing protein n=1 Tax=Mucilaginibacter frigoritolerans TaxID=652788 RepID=A0A562UHH8_9SPHI|nr:NHL repeat-containing protein [Mucilaginibacter frigoritolerans]TWJ04655.1 NHL repeat-containing protein [Mucilaginibacter frigoritolerans]